MRRSNKVQRTLSGQMALKYGPLPMVLRPGENELASGFAQNLADILINQEIFTRDIVVVIPWKKGRRLLEMTPRNFKTWVEDYLVCYDLKFDAGASQPRDVVKTMTVEDASTVLENMKFYSSLRPVERIFPLPLPRITEWDDEGKPTGDLELLKSGYDEHSKTYVFDFAEGYHEWTLDQAVKYLHRIYAEFPFSDWKDVELSDNDGGGTVKQSRSLAVQIAAMLSQFAGGCVPPAASRMGIVYNANSPRSGKSLLCKLAIVPLYNKMAAQGWTFNEEDQRKILDSMVLSASTYIVFDNVRGHMQSQILEGFMTAPTWTGRVLGRSEMYEADNVATIYVTGNQITLSPDLGHRCLVVDLFAEEGDIQEREHSFLLDDNWLMKPKNRVDILSALWAIVRNWEAEGRPMLRDYGVKPRKGFESWGNIIGGMVMSAGFGNPLEKADLGDAGASEAGQTTDLLRELVKFDGSSMSYTFQQIVNIAHNEGIFDYMLYDGQERYDEVAKEMNYELKPKANSAFGLLLKRLAPPERARVYPLSTTERVRFSQQGKGRHKKYIVEKVNS